MSVSWGSKISFTFAIVAAPKKDKLIKHYVQYKKGGGEGRAEIYVIH